MGKKDDKLTFSTDEYRVDRTPISAGTIPPEGLKITVDDTIESNEGDWGPFYSLPIEFVNEDEDWEKGVINFTHKGLFKLVTANYRRLLGVPALLKGEGSGVNRTYTIELLEK